jgi:hypothetical protein
MKRTHEGLFPSPDPVQYPPIQAARQEGRWVWELLIAAGQTDLLACCIAHTTAQEMHVLMRTCKALHAATCELLKSQRMFLVSYNVSLKNSGLVLMAGDLTVPVNGASWPAKGQLCNYLTDKIIQHTDPANTTIMFCPPVEIDQADPHSHRWWHSPTSAPLLPLDVARAHAKEKRKRELDAWAREAGLLPLLPKHPLALPAEPWH